MRHTRCVIRIWNSKTEQEQELSPLEDALHHRITTKTLKKCFAVWQLKFLQIYKLRKAYHKIIQQRLVTPVEFLSVKGIKSSVYVYF
jgi:hypothetical protein